MQRQQVTADLARPEDADAILELNRLIYGPGDVLATRADFAWRCNQNPAGQATIPVIRDQQGEVAGFIWLVPLHMCIKGQNRLGAAGTNLVIHPEHRNSFAYIKLIRKFDQTFQDKRIPLHYSFVSEGRYRQLLKHAPGHAATIPLLVKPLIPSLFAARSPGSMERIAVRAVQQFDSSFDQFWSRVQTKYPAIAVRSSAFLAWRFAEFPQRRYRVLVAQEKDQVVGYAVMRSSSIRGIKTGLVMDLLVADGAAGETAGKRLMAEAEAFFRAEGMSLAVGLMSPHAAEYRILRQAGYIRWPQPLAPRVFWFAISVHDAGDLALSALSARDWFITLADYESF